MKRAALLFVSVPFVLACTHEQASSVSASSNAPGQTPVAKAASKSPSAAGSDVGDIVVKRDYAEGVPMTVRHEKLLPSGEQVRHGPIVVWYETGGKQLEGQYKEGKLDGWWVYWHPNGKLEREGAYDMGERTGPWVDFWDNGQKRSEGVIEHDKQVGKWAGWHENGQKFYEGEFALGQREGTWLFWHDDGVPDQDKSGVYLHNVKQP